MCDRFVTDTATIYQVGQTVFAMVTTFDEEKQRFLVTLKGSEVMAPEGGAQALLLRGLRERRAAEEVLATRGIAPLHPCTHSPIDALIHTHRKRCQPCRATASSSGAVGVPSRHTHTLEVKVIEVRVCVFSRLPGSEGH